METTISWLMDAEEKAYSVYSKAADYFSADQELSMFIRQLAEDEKTHHTITMQAYDLIKKVKQPQSVAVISEKTKTDFSHNLSVIEKGIESGALTIDKFAECLISLEFCEWNDGLSYVVTALKDNHEEFRYAAITIHRHKMTIERFIESHKELRRYREQIADMKDIWEEKILVVDDEPMIAQVIEALLIKEGLIETASNGHEALEKIKNEYYAAIISDVNMPVMDGVELYSEAVRLYPSIRKRFLFFTGRPERELIAFFIKNNIQYLLKPSNLKDIRDKVIGILSEA